MRLIRYVKRIVVVVAVTSLIMLGLNAKENIFAAPVPVVSFQNVESSPFIGESFSFTIRFDNTGDAVGYGPYIDVILPEHVNINSITHLSNSINYQAAGVFPVGAPTCLTHPFARNSSGVLKQVCLATNPGTDVRLYSVKLPFGSFVDTQTIADIVVNVSMNSIAPIGIAKTINSQGGFFLGNDPLDNPVNDPSFDSGFIATTVTPSVIRLSKLYVANYLKGAEENEIVSGPNNSQIFRIQADIANGAIVNNLVLTDEINANLSNLSITSASPAVASSSLIGNSINATWASVTGGTGASDARIDIRFESGYRNGASLITDYSNPLNVLVPNTASGNGDYNLVALPSFNASLQSNLVIKPIAVQKTVAMHTDTNAAGYTPGDTIRYTVDTYVGDYQATNGLVLTDILPDGLTYSPGTSSIIITANGSTFPSAVSPATSAGPGAGETTINWNLSSEGILRGGCIPPSGSGPGVDPDCSTNNGRTRVRIEFRATINDTYDSGNRVEHRDDLNNTVSATSNALSPENLTPSFAQYSDSSSASISIINGSFDKTLYAVNGSTALPSRLQTGDDVTYRLQYVVPSTDFSSIIIDDYLPLPMFTSSQLTTFNATDPLGTIPVPGEANFGDNETLYSYLTTSPILTNRAGNVARFEWPATHDPLNSSRTIDILFTVTINDAAYAPGLFITNQATVIENNILSSFSGSSIQLIELEIPELTITKGAVTSDNSADSYVPSTVGPVAFSAPGSSGTRFVGTINSTTLSSTPIQSDVSEIDAGDIVTFAVVVENDGRGDAYETRIRDTLPSGLVIPSSGLNLQVTDGTGTAVSYSNVGGGTGLFDQGIQITPIINNGQAASGTNIVILTYDLEITSIAEVRETYSNSAQVTRFTAQPAGVNYMNSQPSYQDSADVTLDSVSMTKSVTSTANSDTTGNNVAIGEEITYTLTATVPEGRLSNATLIDTLDACLAVTGFDSLTASAGVTSGSSYAAVLAAASVSSVGAGVANNGRQITLDFGDITNSNSSNGSPETITLIYRVVPINASTCSRGNTRNNSALLNWNTTSSATVSASDVIIQEPTVTAAKSFTTAGGDALDTKTIQLVISAASGSNRSPAYEVVATDDLTGTNFSYIGNMTLVSGVAPTTSSETAGIVTFEYNQLNPGQTSTVRFDVRINSGVQANSTQPNTAIARYTSMLGTPAGLDTFNALACERSGNLAGCGTTENDYTSISIINLTINNVFNSKSQVATSEAHTTTTGVAIGEIVRFRLVSRIPEGVQTNYVLRDQIPNGMSYLNDGTARAAFVFNNALTSSTLTDGALNFTGDETTVASITPTYTLSGGAITAGVNGNGTDVDFNLGTITNADDDASFEYIVIEFNALIRNETASTRGTTLNNNFLSRINSATVSGTTSANSGVIVHKPLLNITKIVSTAPVDAGDGVVYTITITNTAGTNVESGYEWNFTDALDTHLQFSSISNISLPGYATLDSSATSGQNVSAVINRLDPGDSASFRINAIVRDTAPANYVVPNTGNVAVSTLPGSNGTITNSTGSSTPGASGTLTGEEILTGNSSANTTLGTPSIDKQNPSAGADYSIGQLIQYPIVVTVPEGVVRDVVITDALPVGLEYDSHTIDLTDFAGSFENNPAIRVAPTSSPGADGEDIVIDFGDLSTPGTASVSDTFIVNVFARVTNIVANIDGATLSNTASLAYTNPNTLLTNTVTDSPVVITIREPRLTLTKSLSGSGARQVGDTLNYTVEVTNTGSVTAYEWVLTDALPSHVSVSTSPSCNIEGTAFGVSVIYSAGDMTINNAVLAGSTLDINDTLTCTYSLQIENTAIAGTTYTNTADADWRNAPVASSYSRLYNDTVTIPFDGTQDTDTADFTMQAAGISKTDNGRTNAVIGDLVNYTLTISAPDATLADFIVSDSLPAGLIFNNDATITGTSSVVPLLAGPNDGSGPTTVTWDFGTFVHDGSIIAISYTARASNIVSSIRGQVISNDAELSFKPELSAAVTQSTADSFTINEPEIAVTISNSNSNPRFSETVRYTIDIEHGTSSNSVAYGVEAIVNLPSGLTYVSGSESLPAGWSVSVTGQILTFINSSTAVGVTPQLTFDTVLTTTPSIALLTNTLTVPIEVRWSSMAGMVTGERTHTGGVNNYSGTDDSDVTINGINLAIAKDDQVVNTLPGQIIIYDIDYSNTGNASANNIVITETVPEYTTFSSAGSSVGWSCVDGSIAGTVCTYEVPQILALGLGTVDFAVTVLPLADIGRSITQIINSLSIASATSDGIDADLSNNSFTLNTDFQVADVLITKIESIDPVFIDHDYSYTLTITNNGPNIATNILLEDTLPDGVSYRGYTSTGASCIYINPQFSCSLSSLAVGASEIIMLDVTGDTPGVKNNTASIRHDQQDPNLGNNSYTESTLVDPADIVLTKNVDKTTATVGDVVTYTITATNNGPDNATGVSVTDQLPSLLEFVSAKPTQGSCTGTVSVVCSIGSMNNGAVVTVTLQARILGVGIIVNSVNSTLNEFDPVLSNNTNIGVTLSAVAKSPSTGFNQQGYTSIILLLSSASVLLVSAKKYYKYVKKTANTPDQ